MTTPSHTSKAEIRAALLARRRSLDAGTLRRSGEAMARRAWQLPVLARARRIAAYLPVRGEADPTALMADAWARGREVYLPVLAGRILRFARYAPRTPLVRNRYGIPEPASHPGEWRTAAELDVVFTPLVAFDGAGTRLGMGGGWYDRTFAGRAQRTHFRRPRLIGIAHEFQHRAHLPRDAWDILLDAVLTESTVHSFAPSTRVG